MRGVLGQETGYPYGREDQGDLGRATSVETAGL